MTAGCSKFLRVKEYVFLSRLLLRIFTDGSYCVTEGESHVLEL